MENIHVDIGFKGLTLDSYDTKEEQWTVRGVA